MVHHRREPYRSIVIERGQRDNQTAASAQLAARRVRNASQSCAAWRSNSARTAPVEHGMKKWSGIWTGIWLSQTAA
jgi:hypothetical protein